MYNWTAKLNLKNCNSFKLGLLRWSLWNLVIYWMAKGYRICSLEQYHRFNGTAKIYKDVRCTIYFISNKNSNSVQYFVNCNSISIILNLITAWSWLSTWLVYFYFTVKKIITNVWYVWTLSWTNVIPSLAGWHETGLRHLVGSAFKTSKAVQLTLVYEAGQFSVCTCTCLRSNYSSEC